MGELVLGKVRLDPVFSRQFGSQFLLEKGDTALNIILGAFSSTEKLEDGKRVANRVPPTTTSRAELLIKPSVYVPSGPRFSCWLGEILLSRFYDRNPVWLNSLLSSLVLSFYLLQSKYIPSFEQRLHLRSMER